MFIIFNFCKNVHIYCYYCYHYHYINMNYEYVRIINNDIILTKDSNKNVIDYREEYKKIVFQEKNRNTTSKKHDIDYL